MLDFGLAGRQLAPLPLGSLLCLPRRHRHTCRVRVGVVSGLELPLERVNKAPEGLDGLMQVAAAGALSLDKFKGCAEEPSPQGVEALDRLCKSDMDLDLHATSHRKGIYAPPPFKKKGVCARPGPVIAGGMGG